MGLILDIRQMFIIKFIIKGFVTENLKGGDDLDTNYVLSSRVRTGRSIRGLGLPPHCNKAERKEVEKILCDALATLTDEFSGETFFILFAICP